MNGLAYLGYIVLGVMIVGIPTGIVIGFIRASRDEAKRKAKMVILQKQERLWLSKLALEYRHKTRT